MISRSTAASQSFASIRQYTACKEVPEPLRSTVHPWRPRNEVPRALKEHCECPGGLLVGGLAGNHPQDVQLGLGAGAGSGRHQAQHDVQVAPGGPRCAPAPSPWRCGSGRPHPPPAADALLPGDLLGQCLSERMVSAVFSEFSGTCCCAGWSAGILRQHFQGQSSKYQLHRVIDSQDRRMVHSVQTIPQDT